MQSSKQVIIFHHYSTANADELLELVRREGGFMYQTHPRTKGSTGFPDQIAQTDHFQDAAYLGAGWKAMPSDPSSPRLGERSLTLLDDLSAQGIRRFGPMTVRQVSFSEHERSAVRTNRLAHSN